MIVAVIAAAAFALGVSVARKPEAKPPQDEATSPTQVAGPAIMVDPSKIDLLPDASLRLTLPSPPDAGENVPESAKTR